MLDATTTLMLTRKATVTYLIQKPNRDHCGHLPLQPDKGKEAVRRPLAYPPVCLTIFYQ